MGPKHLTRREVLCMGAVASMAAVVVPLPAATSASDEGRLPCPDLGNSLPQPLRGGGQGPQ